MQIKHQKDFWAGVLFLLAGVGFAAGATNYNFGTSARPGPGYFPFGLGILMALLGAFEIGKAILSKATDGAIGSWPLKQLGIILGAVVLFGLLLPKMGLVVALPLLIFISSVASGEFHLKEVLITCVVLTVFSWLIFIKGLGLIIPLIPAFLSA